MGLRDKLTRVEKAAQKHLSSFELEDGSRYYYDPIKGELFLHFWDCLRAHGELERPEPPELLKAMARAKDRRALFSDMGGYFTDMFPYEEEAFFERGELIPSSPVVGHEVGETIPDLSE